MHINAWLPIVVQTIVSSPLSIGACAISVYTETSIFIFLLMVRQWLIHVGMVSYLRGKCHDECKANGPFSWASSINGYLLWHLELWFRNSNFPLRNLSANRRRPPAVASSAADIWIHENRFQNTLWAALNWVNEKKRSMVVASFEVNIDIIFIYTGLGKEENIFSGPLGK